MHFPIVKLSVRKLLFKYMNMKLKIMRVVVNEYWHLKQFTKFIIMLLGSWLPEERRVGG